MGIGLEPRNSTQPHICVPSSQVVGMGPRHGDTQNQVLRDRRIIKIHTQVSHGYIEVFSNTALQVHQVP